MKFKWRKIESGRYESSDGRFVIVKNDPCPSKLPEWIIYDGEFPIAAPDSLKKAKRYVDDLITAEEATNA